MSRLFIVPDNDLEARTIIELLERQKEQYMVTGQRWGASWESLEEEIKQRIQQAISTGQEVYGVELIGTVDGANNIDHHGEYQSPKASIEQVAEIIGHELSLEESFIAENDKGAIAAMRKYGRQLIKDGVITEEQLKEYIKNVRWKDRRMQGITIEQEAQGEKISEVVLKTIKSDKTHIPEMTEEIVTSNGEIANQTLCNGGRIIDSLIILDGTIHSRTACFTDRLSGHYTDLFISGQDGEVNFFGCRPILEELRKKYEKQLEEHSCWIGGNPDEPYGFFGGNGIDIEECKLFVEELYLQSRELKEVTSEEMYQSVKNAKASNAHGAFVDLHDTYSKSRNFVIGNGLAGFAIEDNDLVSVHKNSKVARQYGGERGPVRRVMTEIIINAITKGAEKGDCYASDGLIGNYMLHGAIPLSRTSFVRKYAPDDWNYDRDGEPDLAGFVLAEQNVRRISKKRESFEKYEDIEQFLPRFENPKGVKIDEIPKGQSGYEQMLAFRDDVLPLIMSYGYGKSITAIKQGLLLELSQMSREERKEKIEKMIEIGVEK